MEPEIDCGQRLVRAYQSWVLEHGTEPQSVFVLTRSLDIEEKEFYKHFPSISALADAVWVSFWTSTVASLETDSVFQEYSFREKLLALHFAWFETLTASRSFVTDARTLCAKKKRLQRLRSIRPQFVSYVKNLIIQGKQDGDVQNRPLIGNRYGELLWIGFQGLTFFWLHDTSKDFAKSDEAVEKVINFMCDATGRSFVDSAFDVGVFLLKNSIPLVH